MDTDLMSHWSKNQCSRAKNLHRGRGAAEHPENQLVIKLPDWRVLRLIARSVLLATIIVAFPWLGSMARSSEPYDYAVPSEPSDDLFFFQMLFRDLSEAGLLRPGGRSLFFGEAGGHFSQIWREKTDLISEFDVERQRSIHNDAYDFAFADGFPVVEFIGRALKTGGIVAVRLSGDPSNTFWVPSNFKIVYIRQFDSTVIAMEKTGPGPTEDPTLQFSAKRRLCAVALDAEKKAALMSGLEEVPFEPLQLNSDEFNLHLEKMKYLPDLTGDPLDGYPRRIFVEVGAAGGAGTGWFERHYPKKDQAFEFYNIEKEGGLDPIGTSEWLAMNVREEEYVVMKAEVEVVEEMARSEAICLVDELFLECNCHGQNGNGGKKRRAYWECLALLRRLRDEGIAVHQWWG